MIRKIFILLYCFVIVACATEPKRQYRLYTKAENSFTFALANYSKVNMKPLIFTAAASKLMEQVDFESILSSTKSLDEENSRLNIQFIDIEPYGYLAMSGRENLDAILENINRNLEFLDNQKVENQSKSAKKISVNLWDASVSALIDDFNRLCFMDIAFTEKSNLFKFISPPQTVSDTCPVLLVAISAQNIALHKEKDLIVGKKF